MRELITHPGRFLIRIIYPTFETAPRNLDCRLSQSINIYGYQVYTQTDEQGNVYDISPVFTHDDLNTLLSGFGYTRFKSKKKPDKIRMLMKHNDDDEA